MCSAEGDDHSPARVHDRAPARDQPHPHALRPESDGLLVQHLRHGERARQLHAHEGSHDQSCDPPEEHDVRLGFSGITEATNGTAGGSELLIPIIN